MKRKMSKAEKTARHLPLEEDHWIDNAPDFSQYHGDERNYRMIAYDGRHGDNAILMIFCILILAALVWAIVKIIP